MSETIITEEGEIKIEQQPATPKPVKVGLAQGLKTLITSMDNAEQNLVNNTIQLNRICALLTAEHWEALAITQIRLIAERNADAAAYLTSIGK